MDQNDLKMLLKEAAIEGRTSVDFSQLNKHEQILILRALANALALIESNLARPDVLH